MSVSFKPQDSAVSYAFNKCED